ncbi:MAG TPA: HD domain-containing protein, partial [Ktedonobacteraceae bacterium]
MFSSEDFPELRPYLHNEVLLQVFQENTLYQQIWREASVLLAKGRWYDLVHTAIAIGHLGKILHQERTQGILRDESEEQYQEYRAILIPAIMLHDVGWSAIGENKNTQWSDQKLRRGHMEIGAQLAEHVLSMVTYSPILTRRIVHLVAHHDDQYLGRDPETREEIIHRDADACFIFTFLSFWKDFTVRGGDLSPADFLEMKEKKWGKRYTQTAQVITNKEIVARKGEVNEGKALSLERYEELKRVTEALNKQIA